MKKHIVLCGRRHVGKTTMTERLLKEIRVPVYGFRTKTMVTDTDGTHHIYMYPADRCDGHMDDENHVGDCNTVTRTVNLSVFDGLGVRLLRAARPDGIILMDEIGFMETGSERFCDEVLKALDGDIPVLAVTKDTDLGAAFLDRVRKHENAEFYMLTRENFDEVYEKVLPVVRGWNTRTGS